MLYSYIARVAPTHDFESLVRKGKMVVDEAETSVSLRVGMLLLIFFVSLFAASFPTITRRVRRLRIPGIIFFIGKHFGTGVILSTAFVHLLQDAFSSLQDPRVQERTSIGDWTGLLVLGSLLLIFMVEYISTAYVDRLHSYDSVPASPAAEPIELPQPDSASVSDATIAAACEVSTDMNERTPLLAAPCPASAPASSNNVNPFFTGHHRHESRRSHDEHGRPTHPRLGVTYETRRTSDNSIDKSAPAKPDDFRHAHRHGHGHHHDVHYDFDEEVERGLEGEVAHHHHHEDHEAIIGRKRQVVGILVLQVGIMLHSGVIGLTLSITSGPDFTSLVTAILFHQLFEGLSLGVRIAGLPLPHNGAGSRFLKPSLMVLFALTTPLGMTIGLLSLGGTDPVKLMLAEGILSAISAGMLIYAGCVEMLAADFVLDPDMARAPVRKQAGALIAVLAGMAGMTSLAIVH
ncbi:Zinc/iron permease [Peniophora sp. CONT]|nr:Zinc/iron permease [Peniophora sp. CONT]